jgi:hypothetical protein
MENSNSWTPIEIQQGLLLMIHEYGLADLLDALAELARNGSLGTVDEAKLRNIACYLTFASSEAAERDNSPLNQVESPKHTPKKVA